MKIEKRWRGFYFLWETKNRSQKTVWDWLFEGFLFATVLLFLYFAFGGGVAKGATTSNIYSLPLEPQPIHTSTRVSKLFYSPYKWNGIDKLLVSSMWTLRMIDFSQMMYIYDNPQKFKEVGILYKNMNKDAAGVTHVVLTGLFHFAAHKSSPPYRRIILIGVDLVTACVVYHNKYIVGVSIPF